MDIPLLLGIALCAALIIAAKIMDKRRKAQKDDGIGKLKPGVKLRTTGGLLGVVTEVTEDGHIKADFSPDQTGSVVEITKDAFYKLED